MISKLVCVIIDAHPTQVVFGPDEKDPPNIDVYTSAHISYPAGSSRPAAHLFFPSMFSHFAGTDKHVGPPNHRSNDGLVDTRLLVAHDLRTYVATSDASSVVFLSFVLY